MLNKWRNDHPGEEPPKVDTRIECTECHGYFRYDHTRDEMVCAQCGLTDIVDARRYYLNPNLLPSGWTPPDQIVCFDGISKGDLYHHLGTPEFPHGGWLSRSEPEETSDDDYTVALARGDYDSMFVGSDAKDVRDRGDLSIKLWTYSNFHKYFTHYRFCRTVFRRCRIGIENLPIHCCNRKDSKFCKTICELTVDGLPINCHKYTGGSEFEQCKGCEYAFGSSLLDREHGREGLLDELNYLKLCYDTFSNLPVIFPVQVASDKSISRFLKHEKDRLRKDWNIELRGQDSDKTIKTLRKDENKPWRLRHLVPSLNEDPRIIYKGTPIGKLLEDAVYQGSHALNYLNEYAWLEHDLEFMKKSGEPTRANLIRLFAYQEQENNKPNYGKGKNYYDLLMDYKILNRLKRITDSIRLLCLNPACYQYEKQLPLKIDPG